MLSIGEFSRIALVSTKTLRHYDEIGLLKPKYIDELSGYRYYEIEQLSTMLVITKLKTYQFSLKDIILMMDNSNDKDYLISLINEKKIELESKMNEYDLLINKMDSDILNLERGKSFMENENNYKVELIENISMEVFSIRKRIAIKDFSALIGEVYQEAIKKELSIIGAPIALYHESEFDPTCSDIEVGLIVKPLKDVTKTIEYSKCAKIRLVGSYDNLPSVYKQLIEYIEDNTYQIEGAPFDMYLSDPSKVKPEDNISEVYFPIINK